MASTNSTANLDLSQFVGTDKPDWLTDYNGDMEKIDGAYGAVSATAEEAAANAESAAASASQAAEDAAEALAGISGAIDAAAAAQTAAEQATSVSTSALTVANGAAATAQSAAGDASQALQIANNAKVTAENAQAAAAQSATQAASAAADAATAQAAATQAATDAASAAAIASGVDTRVTAIEECVPSGASSSDKFGLASDVSAAYSAATQAATDAATALTNANYGKYSIYSYKPSDTSMTVYNALADLWDNMPADIKAKITAGNTAEAIINNMNLRAVLQSANGVCFGGMYLTSFGVSQYGCGIGSTRGIWTQEAGSSTDNWNNDSWSSRFANNSLIIKVRNGGES